MNSSTRKIFLSCCLAFASAGACAEEAGGQTARFDIATFDVVGSSILGTDELRALVAPFTGPRREYGDVQRAVEAIEFAYRRRGYSAVHVHTPEQELTGGTVRLDVVEATVGTVKLEAVPQHFNAENFRAALPALVEGASPNARDLSAQIALANENPARQLEVVLGVGARENTVDARLRFEEHNPLKLSFSLDNTGSAQTGDYRLGVALQHANLFNRDHVATFAYQTSPEKPDQVRIFSLSYRLPVYAWPGAFDLILARSTVDAGNTPTTAGPLTFAGRGRVFGLRYTHPLPRQGDLMQKLVFGFDVRANDNSCSLGSFGAAGCGSAGVDVTQRPLSFTYHRTQVGPGRATEFNLGIAANLKGGGHGGDKDFRAARPSPLGRGGADADYTVVRGGFSHLQIFNGDWQARLVGSAQWAPRALIAQEQMGLAGNGSVRGFHEREVARDMGVQASVEGYTPNLIDGTGSLRALAFLDGAHGRNHLLPGEVQEKRGLASWGLGLRYGHGRDLSARLDLAQVLSANGRQERGDWRGHLSVLLSF
jgi:hemolysin activation/secretion protein